MVSTSFILEQTIKKSCTRMKTRLGGEELHCHFRLGHLIDRIVSSTQSPAFERDSHVETDCFP